VRPVLATGCPVRPLGVPLDIAWCRPHPSCVRVTRGGDPPFAPRSAAAAPRARGARRPRRRGGFGVLSQRISRAAVKGQSFHLVYPPERRPTRPRRRRHLRERRDCRGRPRARGAPKRPEAARPAPAPARGGVARCARNLVGRLGGGPRTNRLQLPSAANARLPPRRDPAPERLRLDPGDSVRGEGRRRSRRPLRGGYEPDVEVGQHVLILTNAPDLCARWGAVGGFRRRTRAGAAADGARACARQRRRPPPPPGRRVTSGRRGLGRGGAAAVGVNQSAESLQPGRTRVPGPQPHERAGRSAGWRGATGSGRPVARSARRGGSRAERRRGRVRVV